MGDLDGTWKVERLGGLLPPLVGVTKRIHGRTGTTRVGRLAGVPFVVDPMGDEGWALRYRPPLYGLVDYVELDEPETRVFRGRATYQGREFASFSMRPDEGGGAVRIHDQLLKHIDEAHAMEQSVLRMLDGLIATTEDPELVEEFEHHKIQTDGHVARMRMRLEAHGATPSVIRQAGGILGALAKLPLDLVRSDKAGRNARDAYATEHMEIASYELLLRIAQKAGDDETADACRDIIAEEKAMAGVIEANWDRFVDLTLLEEGVPAA